MTGYFDVLGLKWASLAAGFIGACVSLRFIKNLAWWEKALTVIAGSFAAAYLAPLIGSLLNLSGHLEGAISFLVGLFGMSAAGAVIEAMPAWMEAARKKWGGS